MTEIVKAVRPKPLPSQRKPWARAGIHLLCLYAVLAIPLVKWATSWSSGLEEGRAHMAEAGMLPYMEGEENTVADPVTNEVVEIGPLNYDLRLELGQDWMYGYDVEGRRSICESFQANPDQLWQTLVRNQGFADTPENRATMDATYQEKCVAFA